MGINKDGSTRFNKVLGGNSAFGLPRDPKLILRKKREIRE
jgi:hypothetical protein